MNYELAKQLKDAGFPQEFKNGTIIGDYQMTVDDIGLPVSNGSAYVPTLSELIEACEPQITSIRKTAPIRGSLKARWIAEGWPYLMDVHTDQIKKLAPTPEEAVARLWLSLNEKT